jgi:hypothetical protein
MKSQPETIDLDKIKVTPVLDYFELADVETILSRLHPLGHKKAIGRRMSFAASYKGEWIAVLLFDAAIKRNKHREARIGWSNEQVDARVQHIANNSRYLIVPKYQGVKNLASKVLSLTTDRISDDWMKHYGVALVAVETYVDPEHNDNQGSCYLAAGWERLGYSTGYQPYNQERTHSKWYFLKPLHKDSYRALSSQIPHALTSGVKNVSGVSNNNFVLDASKVSIKDLKLELFQIRDPRKKQGLRYKFIPLLTACICAVISGYTQYRQIADWIRKLPPVERLKFGLRPQDSPDERTISNFLSAIDPESLQVHLSSWLMKNYSKEFHTLCIDGKALRATSSSTTQQKGLLNIFANEIGIVIEQLPTKKGGGEKDAINQFLRSDTDLTGKVILADALHTDQKIIEAIEKKTLRTSSLSKIIRSI